MRGESFDVTAILFRFREVFSGTLYLNHKSLTGSISHEENSCNSLELVGDERVNGKLRSRRGGGAVGLGMVSVGGWEAGTWGWGGRAEEAQGGDRQGGV